MELIRVICAIVLGSSVVIGLDFDNPGVGDGTMRLGPRVPPIPLIKRYAWLTAASYCSDGELRSWDCRSCRPLGNNIRFFRGLNNEQFGARGFVAIDDENKRILTVFRATENEMNERQNRNIVQVPFKAANDPSVKVIRGPLSAMTSLEPQMLETFRFLLNQATLHDYMIAFVGHSLGSSLASLAAAQVKTSLNIPSERMEVYAYGMPRIGNRNFAEWYNHLGMSVARVVNNNDQFPQILGGNSDRFMHIKTEVWVTGPRNNEQFTICDTTTLEDPKCSRSIPRLKLNKELHYYMFDVSFLGELCKN